MKAAVALLALACGLRGQEILPFHAAQPSPASWKYIRGDNPDFARPDFDDSGWATVAVPGTGHRIESGFYWYRFSVTLPAGSDGTAVSIAVPPIAMFHEAFANGQRIGSAGVEPERTGGQLVPRWAIHTWRAGPEREIRFAIRAGWPVPPVALLSLPNWNAHAWIGPPAVVDSRLAQHRYEELQRRIPFLLLTGTSLTASVFFLILPLWRRYSQEYLYLGIYMLCGSLIRLLHVWPHFLLPRLLPALILHTLVIFSLTWSFLRFMIAIYTPLRPRAALKTLLPFFALFAAAGAACWSVRPEWLAAWQTALLTAYSGSILFAFLGYRRPVEGLSVLNWVVGLFVFSVSGTILGTVLPGLAFLSEAEIRLCAVLFLALAMSILLNRRAQRQQEEQQRLAQEMQAAAEIQTLLLPANSAAGIESVYLPANEVGGDFYQVLDRPDGSRMILVGDVSGKGLKAAMVVSVIVGALRQSEKSSPAAILQDLNRVLVGQRAAGFVTCLCLRLGTDGRTTIANGGHPAPYLNGEEVSLQASLPLGLSPDSEYGEDAIQLDAGSTLTLVSDGVVEAENAQRELFGFDRTRVISTRPAAEIAAAAKAWGQNDDITVVTVRRPS